MWLAMKIRIVGLSFCILGGCGPLFPTDAEATSPEEKKSNMAMIGNGGHPPKKRVDVWDPNY